MMTDNKDLEGTYGHAKVDFDDLCDAYDSYGPDLLLINTNRRERYSAVIVCPSTESFLSHLLEWKKTALDEDSYRFASSLTIHLTDAFAMIAHGSIQSPALLSAAEASHMAEGGKLLCTVIEPEQAGRYAEVASRIGMSVGAIARESAELAREVLVRTTPGRQGVQPRDMMINFD